MRTDLSQTLIVGISATALFDLQEADTLWHRLQHSDPDGAIESYRAHMLEKENEPLLGGTGLPLVRALLNLNRFEESSQRPLVEVVVMSRNSPETGLRVLNAIRAMRLNITRSAFTGGESVVDYLEALGVDLFLTTDAADAERVIDSRVCAAAVLHAPPAGAAELSDDQVRIAFDGDAVLFDDSSEVVFKTQGLPAFQAAEDAAQDRPLPEGPHAKLLKKLATLQERLPMRTEYSPVRIAIVTARNAPADLRVIKTLRQWGVYADEAFFLGGLSKTPVLQAFKPHIYFDDQALHLEEAAPHVPSGHVPHASDSPLKATDAAVNDDVAQ
jgi:5'-nucleotidase